MNLESERRRFVGMNVRGTPAMNGDQVEHDLETAAKECGVLALQEFKWRWYWLRLRKALKRGSSGSWATYPAVSVGLARPVFAAQAIAWRKGQWRRRGARRLELHRGAAGISETRQLRAVLLEDRTSGLASWFGTTHFVVGGDNATDGRIRKAIMLQDLVQLEKFLAGLVATGFPGVFQLDANLTPSSHVWPAFQRLLRRQGCTIHGVRGVEYLITWQGRWTPGPDQRGRQSRGGIKAETDFVIPTKRLKTDHEARGLVFRLTSEDLA
jgi:hypothetical protein